MTTTLSIQTLKHQYGRFRLLMAALSVVMLVAGVSYWLGFKALINHKLLVANQQQRLETLYQTVDQQNEQIDFLKVEVEIQKQAAQYLQQQLQQAQQDNFNIRKDLGFYEQIMAPELTADGLVVDSFTVTALHEGLHHYRLVLVQATKQQKRFAKGRVEILIKGYLADQMKNYDVTELSQGVDKDALNFSFRYFQILEGDFRLPAEYTAQSIHIAAILPSQKWQKYARLDRQYRWPQSATQGTLIDIQPVDIEATPITDIDPTAASLNEDPAAKEPTPVIQ